MALEVTRVSVGTTATLAYDAGDEPARLVLNNTGSADIFLGGPGVTTTDGFALAAGATLSLDRTQDSSDDLYAVVATAGPVLHVLAY